MKLMAVVRHEVSPDCTIPVAELMATRGVRRPHGGWERGAALVDGGLRRGGRLRPMGGLCRVQAALSK